MSTRSFSTSSLGRARGCLLGLAIGDALGAAVEFKKPGTFEPVTGYRGGGPHGLMAGEWTDDTSMALALADSIASVGWDLGDQAARYVRWMRRGEYSVNGRRFDIGCTTGTALLAFERSQDPRTCGEVSDRSSGNGSIMRLAPVPMRYHSLFPGDIGRLADLAAESSLVTHASPKCLSACRYLGLVLAGLVEGVDKKDVLSPAWPMLEELRSHTPLHPDIDEVAAGSFRTRQPPQIAGSGYVVRSLEAALWAFQQTDDFQSAVLRAVNLGDDADSTGAVCGQLAGACYGAHGIPAELLNGLAKRELIENALARLLETAD
ncbi:MAG: ADP-ribosylglycohydrolase family protein [Pirellulaceae bacterium]